MKKLVNLSLIHVIAFAIITTFPSCTNVVTETPVFQDTAGWPSASLLAEYGLAGLSLPPEASSISYNNSNNTLTITFTGTAATENAINSFFSTWDEQPRDQSGAVQYSMGIAYVVFLAKNPIFQIQIYKSTTGIPGWPTRSILDKYGLYEIAKPEGVHNISYYEEDGELHLQFYGTEDTEEAIISYFKNNNWLPVGPYGYWKGVTYAELTTKGKTYYSLYATKSIGGTIGWPTDLIETFGLHGLNEPAGIDYDLNYYSDNKSLLVIGFTGDTAGNAILDYFNNSNNHWNKDDFSADTFVYSRGISWVTFAIQDSPYYLLSAYVNVEGKPGWPSVKILENYGLHGLSLPPGAAQEFFNEEDDSLTIGFYGNGNAVNAVTSYFSAANNWKPDPNPSPQKPYVYYYQRGFASVEFDTTVSPYYEIRVILDVNGMPGISTGKFGEYGLQDLTLPDAIHIAWTEEEGEPFIIKFYGTQATEIEVTSYFSAANKWTVDASGYHKGFASVVFITTESPYYEIRVSLDLDGTPGIPPTGKLEEYGLQDITLEDITHAAWTETAGESLTIRFCGTTATVKEVNDFFGEQGGLWESDGSGYSWGYARAAFDTSKDPYFEITITLEIAGNKMDTAPLAKYGLTGLTASLSGASNVRYTENIAANTLTVTFNGTPGTTDAAVIDFFDDNKGSIWEYKDDDDGVYEYSWGYARATFETLKRPYYKISVTLTFTGSETINNAILAAYGLAGLPTSLTGASNVRYTENPAANTLTVTFNGTHGTTDAAVKDFFDKNKGSIWETDWNDGIVYEYAWGYAQAEFDTSKHPYYEISVTLKISGYENLNTAPLVEYGLTGLPAILSGASNIRWYTVENTDENTLIVTFNGTPGITDAAVKDFFDKNKGSIWTFYDTGYAWGYAWAEFDTSKAPYYKISVTLDNHSGDPDLPDEPTLAKYGLKGLTTSLLTNAGATNIRRTDDGNTLTIKFNGTSTTASTVKTNIFEKTTGGIWEYQDGNNGVYEYSWGYAWAVLDISKEPFYAVSVTLTYSGKTNLNSAPLAKYGLTGLSESLLTSAGASNIRYDDSTTNTLIIKFNGTSTTASTIKTNIFEKTTGGIWEYQDGNNGVYEYSWGYAWAEFDTSTDPFYKISVTLEITGKTNLNNAPLATFGLTGLSESLLTNAGGANIRYDDSTTNTLIIKFNGTSATASAVKTNIFEKTNGIWGPQGIKDGAYEYSWGYAWAEFDTSTDPFYKISVTLEITGKTNLNNAPLTTFGLTGLSESLLTSAGATNIRYDDSTTNTLIIKFNGTSNTATEVINNFFLKSGSIWVYEEYINGAYGYYWGNAWAAFDTSKAPYYTIEVYLE